MVPERSAAERPGLIASMSELQRVLCRLTDIADGQAKGFDPLQTGRDSVFVVRRGDRVFVYRDWCPHLGTPMAWRRDAYLNAARDRIVCAAHGALFDIATGICELGPCLGESLQRVQHRVDDRGRIFLSDP
jgi:nitrite reductase/ring-hydroxylating ferredoxin subunit